MFHKCGLKLIVSVKLLYDKKIQNKTVSNILHKLRIQQKSNLGYCNAIGLQVIE